MLLIIFFSFLSIFYIFYSKNSVFSILNLILFFLFLSILLIYIELDFLPLINVIIYVGAVTVLFLFVVMMLDIKEKNNSNINPNLIKFAIIAFIFISLNCYVFISYLCSNCYTLSNSLVTSDYSINIIGSDSVTLYNFLISQNLVSSAEFFLFYKLDFLNEYTLSYSNDLSIIGSKFYTDFFPFLLIAGLILLQSMLGAILLTMPYKRDLLKKKSSLSSYFLRDSRKSIILLSRKI